MLIPPGSLPRAPSRPAAPSPSSLSGMDDPVLVRRLLRQRFAGKPALLRALLQAVTGEGELAALTVRQARHLAALLARHSDQALERMARRGAPAESRLGFRVDCLIDGEVSAAERVAIASAMLQALQRLDWAGQGVELRTLLLEPLEQSPPSRSDCLG